jgi:ketosteroid isomerase-like protein
MTTTETDQFLAEMIPAQIAAERELHNGDPGPRIALWSHTEPVSLFGADLTVDGWAGVEPAFHEVASWFSGTESWEFDIVHAEADADLAYTVAYENTSTITRGALRTYRLRVTHLYRREDGRWRILHRHGSFVPDASTQTFAAARADA